MRGAARENRAVAAGRMRARLLLNYLPAEDEIPRAVELTHWIGQHDSQVLRTMRCFLPRSWIAGFCRAGHLTV